MTLRKQNYRHLSCEYMRQVSSHVLSCAPLPLLAARRTPPQQGGRRLRGDRSNPGARVGGGRRGVAGMQIP
jgi:hypothetical protein